MALTASRGAAQLELLRIALGLALLASFLPLTPHLAELYGDDGWVSREAFTTLSLDAGWYSLFAWCRGPAALTLVHAVFLSMAVAFTAGWGVRWVKWPLWLLYLSYLNRNPAIVYGADLLMASLLLPVCVAPSRRLDEPFADPGGAPSGVRAAVCLALVRWQMAIVFFFTAAHKLRGELWWSGEAVWVVVNNVEFAYAPVAGWLAGHVWLVPIATHGVLLVELAYPFLIWNSRARPWVLGAAIVFHLGTAALFGLYLFAWVAIAGHLSFAPEGLLDRTRGRASRLARSLKPPAQLRLAFRKAAGFAPPGGVRSARPWPSARESCATRLRSSGRRKSHSSA